MLMMLSSTYLSAQVNTFFSDNWLSVLVALIVSVAGGGGIAALIKSRPEGNKIIVDAAQGAVVVQSKVIDSLRQEVDELRSHITEINSLRSRVSELEAQNITLKAENVSLREKVKHLEEQSKIKDTY